MSPAAGRVFGPYRLHRSIAADSVSTTYAATTDGGGPARGGPAHFLLRIAGRVDLSDSHTNDLVRQFLAESQRAGAVNHPSVIRPHDLGVLDDRPYVATPYVRAVPLGDMLRHDGAINDAAALAIFAQLAGALDAGHRAAVVHGALSPRTIWVGPSARGAVAYIGYLMGFGTGVLLQAHLADESTGAPVDDILYVSPEQLRGEPATRASDQYSLACALYHTLVGHPPFERDSRSKLYGAHLMAPVPALAPDEPFAETTGAALRRGMSKQPSDRFDSCGLLINAALPAALIPAVHHRATEPTAFSFRPRQRWVFVLAAAGLIVVGVALWLLFRPAGNASTGSDSGPTVVGESAQPASDPTAPGLPPRWSTAVADAPLTALEVVDGVVVATSEDGTLAGVRPAAGRVGWRTSIEEVRELAVGGAAVVSTGDALTALDVGAGTELWRVDDGLQSLQVTDDAVVGFYETASEAGVRAVGLDDGQELWHTPALSGGDAARAPLAVRSAGDMVVYVLQGGALQAIDRSLATETGPGRQQIAATAWQIDVDDAWPVLAPTSDGVAVAATDGQVCFHARRTGTIMWCEAVPGGDAEQPSLLWTRHGLVATTSRAVVVLEPETGVPSWSVSPGSPGNLVAATNAMVVIADGEGRASVLDAATGDVVLSASGLGHVTALAAHERWLLVGTADGLLHRFDLAAPG